MGKIQGSNNELKSFFATRGGLVATDKHIEAIESALQPYEIYTEDELIDLLYIVLIVEKMQEEGTEFTFDGDSTL